MASPQQQLSERDIRFLKYALKFKNSLDKSSQSLFRVFAVFVLNNIASPDARSFLLQNGAQQLGGDLFISGCNFECAFIGGSICAERSAISVMRRIPRFFQLAAVDSLYIVSDSETPIPPGTLCREMMSEFFSDSLRIVLASDDFENHKEKRIKISSLREFYPYPSLFAQVSRTDILSKAAEFAGNSFKVSELALKLGWNDQVKAEWLGLHELAVKATQQDKKDSLHPLRFGAALQFADGYVRVTFQSKMQEYGSTIDPVRKMAPYIEERAAIACPIKLLQVDQFGNLHPPCAAARSYFVENGHGAVEILVHSRDGGLDQVVLNALVPDTPYISLL